MADRESLPFLTGVVLAAGASVRMGRPKQLLPFGGRPMLRCVLSHVLASGLRDVILVLGARAVEIREALRLPEEGRVRVVVNRGYGRGQSGSLKLGLAAADPRSVAAAVLLGDQPGVTASVIDRTARAFVEADTPIVRPVFRTERDDRVPGHPVFLGRCIWPELEGISGDQGARALIAAHPDWLKEIPLDGPPPADVDTLEDYRAALTGRLPER